MNQEITIASRTIVLLIFHVFYLSAKAHDFLTGKEIAGVLPCVCNSFGNKAPALLVL